MECGHIAGYHTRWVTRKKGKAVGNIDKEKAGKALEELVKAGLSREHVVFYANTVEQDLSYAHFCITAMGSAVGDRYLSEQFVEFLEYGVKVEFDKISVPEVILAEVTQRQDWHKPAHFANAEAFFNAESGEPWHPSLRAKYKATPDVAAWFNDRPYSFKLAVKILTTVYK